MLPINKRVKKDAFPEIMKKGRFLHRESLYIVSLSRGDALPSRFSFVVPSKVKKTSVGRHLIKRRLTAVIEEVLPNIKSGFSAILYVKKDISGFSYQKIKKEILELLATLGYTH